ncbi:MAG: hypothetical protein KA779_04085 [Propionivibrio sp.]|nr:hypothetical protein [Propionivibrio sp.]MBP6710630.1 hypothetical protein [Propionivibrio sp.]MBP7523916.1 hypothetical protein [Propionivibrio sp.]
MPVLRRGQALVAGDESDPAVPQFDQVFDGGARAIVAVGGDRRELCVLAALVDGDHRDAGRGQFAEVAVLHRQHGDHAVRNLPQQLHDAARRALLAHDMCID